MKKIGLLLIAGVAPFIFGAQPQRSIPKVPEIKEVQLPEPEQIIAEEMPVIEQEESMDINIGIAEKNSAEIAVLLNKLLSDEYLLLVKTKNYHWNIKNTMNFNDLHLFFDKQYESLLGVVDDVAERIRSLGTRSFGTMNEFIKNSQLKEQDNAVPSDKEMIKNLLDDHETIIRSLRPYINKTAELQDMGTNNFLCGLIEKHEKMAWMLRSYLK
jgi:starvation-inducible DNA-binding protein